MKHTRELAKKIMNSFKEIDIRTKLIGTVENKGISENDIDLVLLDYLLIDNKLIERIQCHINIRKFTVTNWGGILLETANYGTVDLFPGVFMKECYYCKKKCCC